MAIVITVASLLLVSGTGQGSVPTPRRSRAAVSTCHPAPAPCGSDNLDGLAIRAATEAARRMLQLQTTGTTTITTPTP